ncbi:MAG TPA: Flp family type IVb pilin [Candidatus Cybelea sp.]|nr:Flp family type IVb pilin [Candidatus Cybelea sp.]
MLALTVAVTESLHRLRADARGVTAIEYGMIAGGIAVAIITAVMLVGSDVKSTFTAVDKALNSATGN